MNFRPMLGALAALVVQTALAVPIGGGGGGGGPPDDDPPIDPTCARRSTGTLTATPASIKLGESVIVSWSVSIPAKCKNPGPLTLNGTPVATEGSITVQPMSNAAYVLLLNGVRLGLAQIAVQLPSTVHIKGGTPPWRDLMIQALGTPNSLVLLAANVEMDMTGYENIYIVQGVTLTSEAPPTGNAPPNAAAASGTQICRDDECTVDTRTARPGLRAR